MCQSPCQKKGYIKYPFLLADTIFLTGPFIQDTINIREFARLVARGDGLETPVVEGD
jgi:hypothetical protein